ncbi:MAG TPA: hypothetical protein PLB70_08705 [Paludibacteraceae bacterium]|nr:hypothetical protein [Paludibacteraceae bacterium]
MKRRWMYVILATFFAVFFLYSCTPPTTTNSKEVTIVIDRAGVNRNATLILAQDGLNGEWKELTGTNGIYTFTVNNEQGVYSIAAVDKSTYSDNNNIQLFHSTLAEGKTIDIQFFPDPETDFATLTINFPATYEASQVGIFFLGNHAFPSIEQASVTIQMPKGKSDLVIFIQPDWNIKDEIDEFQKVYIKRNFEIKNDETITVNEGDLKAPGDLITTDDTSVLYSWIINNTFVPEFLTAKKIPNIATNDRYLATYQNWTGNRHVIWSKVTKDVPVIVSNEIKNFTRPTTIINATTTDTSGLPEISFTPYESTISGYKTKFYEFFISEKEMFGEQTFLSYTHWIFVTPGYLAKVENTYKFPNITLSKWKDEYKPANDYVIQEIEVTLSPNSFNEVLASKLGTEWLAFNLPLQ